MLGRAGAAAAVRRRTAAQRAIGALHGFLTRDGVHRWSSFALGREELLPYGVEPRETTVTELVHVGDGFEATLRRPVRRSQSRMALIATGVRDHLPDIPGLDECYGVTVHHCPYCDGWEHRDQADRRHRARDVRRRAGAVAEDVDVACRAVHAMGRRAIRRAIAQQLANEESSCARPDCARRARAAASCEQIAFADGTSVACDAIFFSGGQRPAVRPCRAPRMRDESPGRRQDRPSRSDLRPGLYVVGDASRDVQFVDRRRRGRREGRRSPSTRRCRHVRVSPVRVGHVRVHRLGHESDALTPTRLQQIRAA